MGGDYYDFFKLPGDLLGVLIADVSGKGTSAALYMAELKGLVLSLSQIYLSPRQLLVEVNRIISDNLDTRSFITMTYAVIDLKAGRMTYARAGHTPLIYMRGGSGTTEPVKILVPSGMVVGLRIPGAHEKFMELLEEESIDLTNGDVIVLYTDGISEAMNADADLVRRLASQPDRRGARAPGVERAAGADSPRDRSVRRRGRSTRRHDDDPDEGRGAGPGPGRRTGRSGADLCAPRSDCRDPWLISSRCSAPSRQSKRRW